MLLGVKLDWRGVAMCAGPKIGCGVRESLVDGKGAKENLDPGVQLESCTLQRWLM